ncbi:hypothetical protein [Streptomyces sp. NBC_01190]|uniref:hypothetical protein n=1 Tax=Streptomyces sp. NBC_01190 TaxID=2903767 RepID=UPI003868A215|nr:hypothetical protein OG519_10310 [Streptomyces sp. NBC_01190]
MSASDAASPPPGGNSGIQNIVRGGSQHISGQQSTGAGSRLTQHVGGPAARDGSTVTIADLSTAIEALRAEFAALIDRAPEALSAPQALTVERAITEAATETGSEEPRKDTLRAAIERAAAILGGVSGMAGSVAALQDVFRKLFGG